MWRLLRRSAGIASPSLRLELSRPRAAAASLAKSRGLVDVSNMGGSAETGAKGMGARISSAIIGFRLPQWAPRWAQEMYDESPFFYAYMSGVFAFCFVNMLIPSGKSKGKSAGHAASVETLPAKEPVPVEASTPEPPKEEEAAAPSKPDATTAPAPEAEDSSEAPELVLPFQHVEEAKPHPKPSGVKLQLPGFEDLTAFSDGGAVWILKQTPSGPLYCKLVEEGKVSQLLGASSDGSCLFATATSGQLFACVKRKVAYESGRFSPSFFRACRLAISVASGADPVVLTPSTKTLRIGPIFSGAGGQLIQISGLAPGPPALYRLSPSPPHLVPETSAPFLPNCSVERYLIDAEGPFALGAVMRNKRDGSFSLMMREKVEPRVGGAKWNATCARLGLPRPPVDPTGPMLYTLWNEVARWNADAKVEVLGFKDGLVWMHDGVVGSALAVTADGHNFELPLRS